MHISLTALAVLQVAEEHGDPAINPWFIGGGAFGILVLVLALLVGFGGGRDHS